MRQHRVLLGLAVAAFCVASSAASGAVIGYWRFDNDTGASDGANINAALSEVNGLTANRIGNANGTLKYMTSSLPGPYILDPITNTVRANTFAARVKDRRLRVPGGNLLLNPTSPDTSFTFEFFLRIIEEPKGYNSFSQRFRDEMGVEPDEAGNHDIRRWQVDFNHGKTKGAFGRIRSRWDTPQSGGSKTPGGNNTSGGGDWNSVSQGDYVYVDTDTGSGDPNDYIIKDNKGNLLDVSQQGDGINDLPQWHHVALVWDAPVKQFTIYTNYQKGTTRTLNGAFEHPNNFLDIVIGSGFEYYIDEVRYTGAALSSNQFLRAVPEPSSWLSMAGLMGLAVVVQQYRRRRRTA